MLLMCWIWRMSSPKIRLDKIGGHKLGDQIRSMVVQPNSPSTDICFSSKKATALPCLTENMWSLSVYVCVSISGWNQSYFPMWGESKIGLKKRFEVLCILL